MTVEPAGPAGSVPPDEPAAARALRRIDGALGLLEVGLLVLFLAILIGTAVYQVIADQLLGDRETWPYEVIRYGVFAVAMSGGALASQRQGMFNMDLVTRKFGPRLRSILRIATAILVAALCLQVVRSGLDLRSGQEQLIEAYELISPARAYNLLVAGFSLIALHFLLHAAIEVIYLAGGKLPPEPPHGGHG